MDYIYCENCEGLISTNNKTLHKLFLCTKKPCSHCSQIKCPYNYTKLKCSSCNSSFLLCEMFTHIVGFHGADSKLLKEFNNISLSNKILCPLYNSTKYN